MEYQPVDEKEFREQLLQWRKQFGFSRERLSEVTGVSVSTLMRIEQGNRAARLDVFNSLAAIMAIEPQAAFWDREKTKLFFYARRYHSTRLFHAVVFTWLFQRRYQKVRESYELMVGGQKIGLWADVFPGVERAYNGYLLRLPSEYGFMLVPASRQGSFQATMITVSQ